MIAVFKYPAMRFDGIPAGVMDMAKFAEGAEVTLKMIRYPEERVEVVLRPTVDYVDWEEFVLEEGDVIVQNGVGQRFTVLKGISIERGSYPHITFEEE